MKMVEHCTMSKHRILFFLFLPIVLFGQNILSAKKNINYKEVIKLEDVEEITSSEKLNCVPMNIEEFKTKKFIAKHYIAKSSVICKKSIEEYKKEAILFDFGSFQIETEGKVIFENNEFVRIKKSDGSIEKIFKDGRGSE